MADLSAPERGALDAPWGVLEAVDARRSKRAYERVERDKVPKLFGTVVDYAGLFNRPPKGMPGHHSPSRPRIGFLRQTVPGLVSTYWLRTADGQELADISSRSGKLREMFGAHAVRFEEGSADLVDPGEKINHRMHVLWRDPLPRDQPWPWGPPAQPGQYPGVPDPLTGVTPGYATWRHDRKMPAVGFAMTETLRLLEAPLAGVHFGVFGKTNAGKSYTMRSLAALVGTWQPPAVDRPHRCIIFCVGDTKHSFANQLEPRCTIVARTPEDIEAMFMAVQRFLDRRQRRKTTMEGIVWPTEAAPLVWIFIDELATYMEAGSSADKRRRELVLTNAARTIREAGGVLVIGMQHPYAHTLPPSVRGNISFSMQHQMDREEQISLGLNPGWQEFVSIKDVRRLSQGAFMYSRGALGGPSAAEEYGDVRRARGLLLSEGEFTWVMGQSSVFRPQAEELQRDWHEARRFVSDVAA
ncbi:MAG: hypothetical protein S0880_10330 [Actinomycetota bacterium]|nr:hypothetical protein [Actinomycetota bacterium]